MSSQMQTNAVASSTKIGTNHAGNTAWSWGNDPNSFRSPGSTRYSANAEISSPTTRMTIRRRDGAAADAFATVSGGWFTAHDRTVGATSAACRGTRTNVE